MGKAEEFRWGTRRVDSRFSSLHRKWKSVGVVGFTGGRRTIFGSSYQELRRIEDPSKLDSPEMKIIKVSRVSHLLLAYISFHVSHLFQENNKKIKHYQVSQFVFIPEFNAFARVNENPKLRWDAENKTTSIRMFWIKYFSIHWNVKHYLFLLGR